MEIKVNNFSITLDSNKIIGVLGNNNNILLKAISEKNDDIIYLPKEFNFFTDKVQDEIIINNKNSKMEFVDNYLKKVGFSSNIKDRKISSLSSGEKRMLSIVLVLIKDSNTIIVDEPFFNLDYQNKKKLINIFHDLKTKSKKTIIIGSNDPNCIYSYCDKALILKNDGLLYDDVDKIFINKENISLPNLVKFSNLVRKKGVNIGYFHDIRDLIKDVYRHV